MLRSQKLIEQGNDGNRNENVNSTEGKILIKQSDKYQAPG